ncbi:MAG: iron-sulfur cluster biosynthesis protein [Pseudonocardiaceae bacterium]
MAASRVRIARGSPYGNGMLTVTEAAAKAITSLVTKNNMPAGAGLRIAPQSQSTRAEGLGLSIAAAPADEDTVLEAGDAKIFLASTVVYDLHEQELDVEPAGDDEVRFIVGRRPKQ